MSANSNKKATIVPIAALPTTATNARASISMGPIRSDPARPGAMSTNASVAPLSMGPSSSSPTMALVTNVAIVMYRGRLTGMFIRLPPRV